jgi:hypothetical protein
MQVNGDLRQGPGVITLRMMVQRMAQPYGKLYNWYAVMVLLLKRSTPTAAQIKQELELVRLARSLRWGMEHTFTFLDQAGGK